MRIACFLSAAIVFGGVAPLAFAQEDLDKPPAPEKPRLDAHGFALPAGATARLGDLHFAQRGWINGIKLSPDGTVLATGGNPYRGDFSYGEWATDSIYFWNAETGRVTREVPIGHGARPVAFSSDGKLLAVSYERGLTVLNVETGKEQWPRGVQRPEPPDPVVVHFLDNDRLLAVRTYIGIQLWDVAKGTLARKWEAVPAKDDPLLHRVEGLKLEGWGARSGLSPSGKVMAWLVLARAGKENWPTRAEVHVFDTVTGERKHASPLLQGFQLTTNFSMAIALLDEGETVLLDATFKGADRFGRQDIGGNVALDVKTGKERFRIHTTVGRQAHVVDPDPGPLRGEGFHKVAPNGKSFYTWSTNEIGYVRRDIATGKVLAPKLVGFDRAGYRVFDFTPDGKGTVVADFARWGRADLDLKAAAKHGGSVQPFAGGRFLSNNRILYDGKVWDRAGKFIEADPNPRARWYPPSHIGTTGHPASYDSSHRRIASNVERRVIVYDIEADRELCKLEGVFAADEFAGHWPVLSNDGSRVLVPLADGNDLLVNWYDAKTGRKLGSYRVPKAEVFPNTFPLVSYRSASSAAAHWFADDGSVFGYTTRDSRLTLVDTATSKVSRTMGVAVPFVEKPAEVPPAPVGTESRPMFHPGDRVPGQPAWGYWRSGAFIVARRVLPGGIAPFPNQSEVEHLFLDPETGALVRRFMLSRHAEAFSRDGRFAFVRSGWDGIAVYETATGKPRGIIQTHAGSRPTVELSPDGRTMTTGCADTSVLIWDLNRPLGGGPDLTPADAIRNSADVYHRMLATLDPGTAEPALWALVRAPEQTAKLLADRLTPAEKADANLIGEPRLPDRVLRDVRALEVLERIGTPEAKKIVEAVAKGHTNSLLTREAKLVLARWK